MLTCRMPFLFFILQEAMKRSHKMCAIMVDTLGREIMVCGLASEIL